MNIKHSAKIIIVRNKQFLSYFFKLLIYLCKMPYNKCSLISEEASLIVMGKSIDMSFSKISFFVAISTVTLLGGCLTSQFDSDDSGNTLEVFYPLQQIQTEVMSDPSSSRSSAYEAADSSMYEKGDSKSDGRMTSLELPSNATDLFPASIAGVWNLSMGGKVCRIATPQTKFGQGYRARPLHCPGIVSQVSSWAVKEKRLYFYNNSGRVIVTLYSSNVDRFEGRTLDDHPVVLSR